MDTMNTLIKNSRNMLFNKSIKLGKTVIISNCFWSEISGFGEKVTEDAGWVMLSTLTWPGGYKSTALLKSYRSCVPFSVATMSFILKEDIETFFNGWPWYAGFQQCLLN